MSVVTSLKNIFSGIFGADTDIRRKRAALKKIYADIKAVKPVALKKSSGDLQSGLAQVVLRFYQTLIPLKELFSRTISNQDEGVAEKFKNLYIENRISSSFMEQRLQFSYGYLSERILKSKDPQGLLKKTSNEFQRFLKPLNDKSSRLIDMDLKELHKFATLCSHRFEDFLHYFDSRIDLQNPNYKPSFHAVNNERAVSNLQDIYFIAADLNPDFINDENIGTFYRLIGGEVGPSLEKRVNRELSRMKRLLNVQLSPTHLLNVLRAAKKDPFFTPKIDSVNVAYVAAYKKRLITHFQNDMQRIIREVKDAAVNDELLLLFGDTELLPVRGYSAVENKKLESAGLALFTFCKPLSILKTFMIAKFEKNLRENLKKVLIEGFFEDKSFQESLSGLYYKCEKSFEKIIKFEETLTGGGTDSIEYMERYIDRHKKGKDSTIQVKTFVSSVNTKVAKLIQEETNLLYRVTLFTKDILSDYKKGKADFILNIKSIGGANNTEIVKHLHLGYKDLVGLVKIMKHFTSLKAQGL
jgi:hypothetical protein